MGAEPTSPPPPAVMAGLDPAIHAYGAGAGAKAVSDQTGSSFPRKREPRASEGVLPWTPACAGVTKKWIHPVGKCAKHIAEHIAAPAGSRPE